MSLTGKGWRQGAADFLTGIADADALATAIKNGTMSVANFLKLSAMPQFAMVSTPEIDLLTLNAQANFDFSNLPASLQASTAKTLFFAGSYYEITQLTGTATGNGSLTVFKGATQISATGAIAVSSAAVNGGFALPQALLAGLPRTVETMAGLVAGPLFAKVTTAVAGPTVLKAKIVMSLFIDIGGTVL